MRYHKLLVCSALSALMAMAVPATAADPAPAAAALPRLALRGALDQTVAFHGALDYDKAGAGAGNMMYPAPGLAGLLVAIATHAAISNGVRDAEKQKMRDQADLILAPHQAVLGGYKCMDLMHDAVPLITASADLRVVGTSTAGAVGEVVMDSTPVFYMTQDRRALVMENAISIRRADQAQPYEAVIRVVSPAKDADVGTGFWFDDGAGKLKATSARMFAQSVDVAVKDSRAGADPANVFKTVRYSEGGTERMERAQIVTSSCENLVLRTLRGNLMVVPRRAVDVEADAACKLVQAS